MRLRLLFLLILLVIALPAYALDALVVQGIAVKPYEQVFHGFHTAFPGDVRRMVLAEGPADPVRAVREAAPDVIVAVGADALARMVEIEDVPIVYAMVLNPETVVPAKANITGVPMMIAPESQLQVLRKVLPVPLRSIGVLYNPEKTGSYVRLAAEAARQQGLELAVREVFDADEVPAALASLPAVDALWLLPDQTVVGAGYAEGIGTYAARKNLPVLAFSEKYLREGALLALELDTRGIGRQAAKLAGQAVPGAAAPPAVLPEFRPALSRSAAGKLHLPEAEERVRELGGVVVD